MLFSNFIKQVFTTVQKYNPKLAIIALAYLFENKIELFMKYNADIVCKKLQFDMTLFTWSIIPYFLHISTGILLLVEYV